MNKPGLVLLLPLITTLLSCSSNPQFVSVERKFSQQQTASGFHRVAKGETLFSIAWRYGVDYRQLASTNSISSPYTIYPGQKIDIRVKPAPPVKVSKPSVEKPSKPAPVVKPAPKVVVENSHKPPKKPVKAVKSDWKWPLNGRLIAQFSTKKPINKGIDIAAPLGESVLAAAAGTVVYAGTGLRGYGNLVIVKHDDTYLSAYAHTSRIWVKENEVVQVGQRIADIGSTGTDKVKLHFEIRKNGKPVDPLSYLPRR